jgi:hypothetical protein
MTYEKTLIFYLFITNLRLSEKKIKFVTICLKMVTYGNLQINDPCLKGRSSSDLRFELAYMIKKLQSILSNKKLRKRE